MSTSSASVLSYKRFKSAHGRLQSLAAGEGAGAGKKPRRVRSARETRESHESSMEVFPELEEAKKKDKSWGRTQYGDNYGPKSPVTPVPVRPVSPTRRNNPHPAQVGQFPALCRSPWFQTRASNKFNTVIYALSEVRCSPCRIIDNHGVIM